MTDHAEPDALQNLLTNTLLHDLKNQVHHLVLGLESVAARVQDPADIEPLVTEACNIGDKLTGLLLAMRLQQNCYALRDELQPIHQLLTDVRDDLQHSAQTRGLSLSVDAPPDLLAYLDVTLVGSTLQAAGDNAIRHARSAVMLRARKEGDWLLLSVDDDGPGFPEASVTANDAESSSRNQRRTGLGLQLALEVASAHHIDGRQGRIELSRSEEMGGARFLLRLPV